jgi:8-oxo-dGTP diphosphatase
MPDTRPLFTIGAFAVIFDDSGQVLLSHRRDMDAWNLPGGGMEPGELPDECIIREVREETGLNVEIDRLVGVYGKTGRSDMVFTFICRIVSGSICETDESDACAYFDPQMLPPNILFMHIERINDAVSGGQHPLFRRQGMHKSVS